MKEAEPLHDICDCIEHVYSLSLYTLHWLETVASHVCAQPDIPHIDEHVSKVECIGVKTQQKLLDIKGAAAAVGIADLNVVHNSITTGEFQAYCSFSHHPQSPWHPWSSSGLSTLSNWDLSVTCSSTKSAHCLLHH